MGTAAKGAKSKSNAHKANHKGSKKVAPAPKGALKSSAAKAKKAAAPVKGKFAALKEALLGKKKPAAKQEKLAKVAAKAVPGKASKEGLKTGKKGAKSARPEVSPQAHEAKTAKSAKGAAPAPLTKEEIKKAAKAAKAAGKAALGATGRGAKAELSPDAVCREVACEGLATTVGYCRLHYIKNWKKIQRKAVILREKKLNQYIEELVLKYPDKYIEAIRQDLENDKDFAKVIHDLDLDESVDEYDAEGEADEGLIDNIRREIEDEGETF